MQRYNSAMARGWESKSVESQQDEAASRQSSGKPRLTAEAAARLREKESLRLSLQSITERLARTRDPRHKALLENTLTDLRARIDKIENRG